MSSKIHEITLEKFIYGGEVMGRLPDNRAVFVPFALPGERVKIEIIFEKRGFARGKLLEILEASPERISAQCKYFGQCAGCAYQHLPYEAELRAKEEIIKDQLLRIGKLENPPVQKIIPSPEIWHYKQEMDFQIGKSETAPNILEVDECHLPAACINAFWEELEFGENGLFDRFTLRHDAAENLSFIIHGKTPETPEMTLEDDLSVIHIHEGEMIVMGGDDHLVTTLHGRPLRVSASSFLHPNAALAEKLIDHLLETLPLAPQKTLLELHSGVGALSAFLAPKVGRLVCIERDETACNDFSLNLDEFENVELYQAQAMDVLPQLDFTPDILLADPPVGGLGRHTLDMLLAQKIATFAYISRDPSTLARDAKRLIEGGYKLHAVTPFDAAPRTAQIDSVAIFVR